MTPLTLEGLNKSFGDLHILKDISLSVKPGDFVSLLGPSGCGKTTTLRCIAGFERPDTGRILFGERDVTRTLPEKRDIGMVFQSYALFPHMSVMENLSFGLEARRIKAPERLDRCRKVLSMVRLEGYEDRFPRELSGGQQQRVALARALVIEPSVLLLDEPLANLDATLRDEMRFFIRDLQQRVGITSIYVTHDQSEAMVMSDLIVVMQAGKIVQAGTPREIYEQPASNEVAGFIGRSNTIAGKLVSCEGERYTVETPVGRIATAGPPGQTPERDVRIMIRPENIFVRQASQGENGLSATVTQSIYQGAANHVTVTLPSGEIFIMDMSGRRAVKVGEQLPLSFSPDDAWLLTR